MILLAITHNGISGLVRREPDGTWYLDCGGILMRIHCSPEFDMDAVKRAALEALKTIPPALGCRHLESYPTDRTAERGCCQDSQANRTVRIWHCPACDIDFVPQDMPARR
jgi:hypothetical protein